MTSLILALALTGQTCANGQCSVGSRVVTAPAVPAHVRFTAEYPLYLEPATYIVESRPVIVRSYVERVRIIRHGWFPGRNVGRVMFRGCGG